MADRARPSWLYSGGTDCSENLEAVSSKKARLRLKNVIAGSEYRSSLGFRMLGNVPGAQLVCGGL